jgi:hypothetical protein
MRKIALIAVFIAPLLVTGCGDGSQLEDIIKSKINDPKSAQFKDATFSQNGNRACISWNSKNSTGGYESWKTSEFRKTKESNWVISSFSGSIDHCSENAFKTIEAENDAHRKALELYKGPRSITAEEIVAFMSQGICADLYHRYIDLSRSAALGESGESTSKNLKDIENGFSNRTCKTQGT